MTSRQRKHSSMSSSISSSVSASSPESGGSPRWKHRKSRKTVANRQKRRGALLEKLEDRQLLAGPQLIGIQPNEGDLIVDGSVRDNAPRTLTFRFDEDQRIDPTTLGGIQIVRAGDDGLLDTDDDEVIQPGSVSLGEIRENEVVVRFAESLPDDTYRLAVFGFDDPARGITGLRNQNGEFLLARGGGLNQEVVEFQLDLGAQIESIVPQPVVRNDDGTLDQRRNEILVYFNEDELFVENDPATGQPTARSAENPRFYQLLLTQETINTLDDLRFEPEQVIYDAETHTARLVFGDDLNELPGVPDDGGTFRLRIGTAVDASSDLLVEPSRLPIASAGDTLMTAADIGSFGGDDLTSLLIEQAITPQASPIQLMPTIPEAINPIFDPDAFDGVSEIAYNFNGVFAGGPGTGSPVRINNLTEVQKRRVRESLSLWSHYIGVQFRETVDEGITFAAGNRDHLLAVEGAERRSVDAINADLLIDPNFVESTIVFGSESDFQLQYGEDFFRKSMAGIGFLLGLDTNSEAAAQTLMALDPRFLNGTIDPEPFVGPVDPFFGTQTSLQQTINPEIQVRTIDQPLPNSLPGLDPVFPGNQDIQNARSLYRPDSVDVDLYRFEVSLNSDQDFGTLSAETFAERLEDASGLDTTLTLFEEVRAGTVSDFGLGPSTRVRFTSLLPGTAGNRTRIEFVPTNASSITVAQIDDADGQPVPGAIRVQLPSASIPTTVGDVVDALRGSAAASALMDVQVNDSARDLAFRTDRLDQFSPIIFTGGGVIPLTQNDDYFSEDSFLTAELSGGVYYLGVTASGNQDFDPNLSGSGSGGRTQGAYEVALKFEPQVSQTDVIRDRDNPRAGVPGTAIDGDLDGRPGGENNFWFQTRPFQRVLRVNASGEGITSGQTMTITGANGVTRRFEFVRLSESPQPGNIAIQFSDSGAGSTPDALAQSIRSAISSVASLTGVTASASSGRVTLAGERIVEFSDTFTGVEALGRMIFVDKIANVNADGTLANPFNNIASEVEDSAFDAALPGDIVRIVGNGGQDGRLETSADNAAYRFGISEIGGRVLADGRHMDVPKGVTTMIDAGAAFKFRAAAASVGSDNLLDDRSGGVLQVLGAPRLVQISDPTEEDPVGLELLSDSGEVVFTSLRDRVVDAAASGQSPAPSAGDWGGIILRQDFDDAQGRSNLESEGIFLQHINHAAIRYGGGSNILINAVQQTVNAIQIVDTRPTITFNQMRDNADSAVSASPNSFETTTFQEPRFQRAGRFTADYDRIGPQIRENLLSDNSINGMLIRTDTTSQDSALAVDVTARFDDLDIVHYIAQNVVVRGTPGGTIQDGISPNSEAVTTDVLSGGSLDSGDYTYRITFVDAAGFESLASDPVDVSITGNGGLVRLRNLPLVDTDTDYVSRRLYRSDDGGDFRLIGQLNQSDSQFVDRGDVPGGAVLDLTREGIRGRLDGSLVVDPGLVFKMQGARIELQFGTQMLAEGTEGTPIVMTSVRDDRFGAGGSFDTNNDADGPDGGLQPNRGDWSGIYAGPTSNVSFDHTTIAYGGGISFIESGQSRGFAALELQQADGRITNSRFENNDSAIAGSGPSGRNGRLAITPSTIFVRGSQPIIVDNDFVDNFGTTIDIDLAAINDEIVVDPGRQTGAVERFVELDDNQGPLVRGNRFEAEPGPSFGRRQLSGLRIRGGELTSGSVWDDTDIVHVLFDSVVVSDQSFGSSLLLRSRPDESLVVKLTGQGTPNSATAGTGITATGLTSSNPDRIGGTVQIVGLPGAPVVLTSLSDDSVGAGRRLDNSAQADTNGDGFASRPFTNDWRSVFMDRLSNDRNVKLVLENELSTALPTARNANLANAENLGGLASSDIYGDDLRRAGFEVRGFLTAPGDVDTYEFEAESGTQIWVDVDSTSVGLDSVVEIVNSSGEVLARSDDSYDEVDDPDRIEVNEALASNLQIGGLGDGRSPLTERQENGLYFDAESTNFRDAGLRLTLPGDPGLRNSFFLRVRSASADQNDIRGGQTTGSYQIQIRLAEEQEIPGNVVRHADIRYANHGVHVQGLPNNSPLIGDAAENEAADPLGGPGARNAPTLIGGYSDPAGPRYPTDVYSSNDNLTGGFFNPVPVFAVPDVLASRPQNLGDLANSKDGTFSVAGQLFDLRDVDFYQFDIGRDGSFNGEDFSTVFDIDYADGFDRPDTNLSVFYSTTANPAQAQLVLFGEASNIVDDQSSPLATQVVGELLNRGSQTQQDPLIGPIALPAGSYFVAVTEGERVPTVLNDDIVRRAPIDSIERIFDDGIEVIGGATATPPRQGSFVDVVSPGWSITTDRSTDPGHQRTGTFEVRTPFASAARLSPLGGTSGGNSSGGDNGEDQGRDDDMDSANPVADNFVDRELLIGLEDDLTDQQRDQFVADNQFTVLRHYHSLNVIHVQLPPSAEVGSEIERLSPLQQVKYAEPNFLRSFDAVPNDTRFDEMYGLNNTGQTGGTADADIDAVEAWDTFTGSDQVVIAVVDSGLDLTHPDLVDNLWINPNEIPGDGIDNDNNGYIDDVNGIDPFDGDVDPTDSSGHGTHVAGTTAAVGNNDLGVTGVNWNAKIMPIRVCDVICTDAGITEGIEYVTMMAEQFDINVVVSNHSYGGPGFSQTQFNAVQRHVDAGIGFVTSAGNDASNNDNFPQYPSSFNIPEIISVAASDDDDLPANFTNLGPVSVDLSAPGVDVLSTLPGGTYGLNSGTSMASPHVAGAYALLAGFDPDARPDEIRQAILLGADPVAALAGTTLTGARLNADLAFDALAVLRQRNQNNESYHFDRSDAIGTLTSSGFDLTGYGSGDLPRFYFDYFLDASDDDDVQVTATSDQQTDPLTLNIDLNDDANQDAWRQGVVDLAEFAGDTNVRIRFTYNVGSGDGEGLYLDNFIVGFAERGEMVFDAGPGDATFSAPGSGGQPGEYQLEIRPGTEYTRSLDGALLIERTLSSNPDVIDPLIISLTDGIGTQPYGEFSFDVGDTSDPATAADRRLTFQFQPIDAEFRDDSLINADAVAVSYSRDFPRSVGPFGDSIENAVIAAIESVQDVSIVSVRPVSSELLESFDTNDRHAKAVTLVAPSGQQLSDGDAFTMNDGTRTVRLEFNNDGNVSEGAIGVSFTEDDTPAEIAESLIRTINSPIVQGEVDLRASTAAGLWDFDRVGESPTDGRIAIHGRLFGDFLAIEDAAEVDGDTDPLTTNDDDEVRLAAIFHDGRGDVNNVRSQGQVVISNNQITEVHAYGVWSDPGYRGVDPEDSRDPADLGLGLGNNFLQLPPVGNTNLGAAKNFPTLNESVEGGMMPGITVVNNIIDQAGVGGIQVDGETRPFVIEWNGNSANYTNGGTELSDRGDVLVPDGYIFAIDAGGTRVVFEFEDVQGAPTNLGGSGVVGGDGFVDGHVPIYYRLGGGGTTYGPNAPDPVRNTGYSYHELLYAIYEAIQGSILVTNGLVELVRPTLGPSLTNPFPPQFREIDDELVVGVLGGNFLDFPNPAIYLEGVSNMYSSTAFQKDTEVAHLNIGYAALGAYSLFDQTTGETFNGPPAEVPVYQSPQPLAKIVNNTVRGADGTEAALLEDGTVSPSVGLPTDEPNDVISQAVDTKLEVSHRGAYIVDGTIGDHIGPLPMAQDVDFFKVELNVGDRLIADIDTADDGPTTAIRLFDADGVELAIGESGAIAEYLNPGSSFYRSDDPADPDDVDPDADDDNDRDGFLDYTALEKGTYFVGISGQGNESYEPQNLADRVSATGGTGDYTLGLEVLAPRTHVLSLDHHRLTPFNAEETTGAHNGTTADGNPVNGQLLIGTTFTISQVPDYLIPTRPGDAYTDVVPDGNRVTFEFTGGVNQIVLNNGNINVPILDSGAIALDVGYAAPDIMRAISGAINGYLNNPALPNHEVNNGPGGVDGPVTRVSARALGGTQTDNVGIRNFIRDVGFPFPANPGLVDFTNGFGHDRWEDADDVHIVPDGTFTDANGTTEIYVAIANAAKIELSPEARDAGLRLGPDNNRDASGELIETEYASEADQVLIENGIFIGNGASAAIMNNVVVNAHQSIVREETSLMGFGGRIDELNPRRGVKRGEITLTGNVFQHDETRNTQVRSDVSMWYQLGINVINRNPALDGSISTDFRTGPSNIDGGDSDFNFVVRPEGMPGPSPGGFVTFTGDDLFVDAAAGNFTPSIGSEAIDSAVDFIEPNTQFATLLETLGLEANRIEAPKIDQAGQERADEPTVAPIGGLGSDVFIDRGALDRADFIGPFATLLTPRDNDFNALDSDPATSFVQRSDGVFKEFRLLLQDLGDDSDPFVGTGVDDSTVLVSPIPGLRPEGANFVLFENDRVLTEGIDYTFSYDETRGVVTFTPLAGIWRDDRAYRIAVNNRDRTVVVAPSFTRVRDGDQVIITDDDGATVFFEFETGYQIRTPEVLTLIIPEQGTNTGGISDGDVFTINDGTQQPVLFEFDNDGNVRSGTVAIPIPDRPTPVDPVERETFLSEIANETQAAIQGVIDDGLLDADLRVMGRRVLVGTEAGATIDTSGSNLGQAARTLAFRVPVSGVAPSGLTDGDVFAVGTGDEQINFEINTDGAPSAGGFVSVSLASGATAFQAAAAISAAINDADLGLQTVAENNLVFLDLPLSGTASVTTGRLGIVGVSRTPMDETEIEVIAADGSDSVVLELNRVDEPNPDGEPMDDGVTDPNVPVNLSRTTTANELAAEIAAQLQTLDLNGLNFRIDDDGERETLDTIKAIDGGFVQIGGEEGLQVQIDDSTLILSGTPSVSDPTTIQITVPLLLNMPGLGGAAIPDGSVLIIRDQAGDDVVFEFNVNGTTTTVDDSLPINFDSFDDADSLANLVVAAINSASLGITATNLGGGRVTLGNVERSRVITTGIPDDGIEGVPQIQVRLGNVSDGEQVTITRGDTSLTFEFDSIVGGGGVAPGNIPVRFLTSGNAGEAAVSLAAAITDNGAQLGVTAVAERNAAGEPIGSVQLNDQFGTSVDVSQAPTLTVSGVPGGAVPVRIEPGFPSVQIKQALIDAINSQQGQTVLVAEDRGGDTFFVENGELFSGSFDSFFLPAVKDITGNPLEPNRLDGNTTQFTILMPTISLDFGDAPDPRDSVPGRLPSLLTSDGARHVVTPDLLLGRRVDAEPDALSTPDADGDDLIISVNTTGSLFDVSVVDGFAEIRVQPVNDLSDRDGDTITLDLGGIETTLEFDTDGIFAEENFAIAVSVDATDEEVAAAVRDAVIESPLRPGAIEVDQEVVRVLGDDEDGVSFTSDVNPLGIFNAGVATPIDVTVTGSGVLEAWIDFNADGDFDDPGEQVISRGDAGALFVGDGTPTTKTFSVPVPPTAAFPNEPTQTFARFRVSREGNLGPDGLALSGEVEDYAVRLVPGAPATIGDDQASRTFTVAEDDNLQVLDRNGNLTADTNDNGLLSGVSDPDGDEVRIFEGDVGTRLLSTPAGTAAGTLTLQDDGTFSFVPEPDFTGEVSFTARVASIDRDDPNVRLVSSTPINVTIQVQPVNDPPVAVVTPVLVTADIDEDETVTFTADELLTPFYVPGPDNESDQTLLIQEARSGQGLFTSELGGSLSIAPDGQSVTYTPPADFNSETQTDTFVYLVADVPGEGQTPLPADALGRVTISIAAVNDDPRVGEDQYNTQEDVPLTIPVSGPGGILSNDTPGPQDEIDAGQTVAIATSVFPLTTTAGGSVTRDGNLLTYTPPAGFSGDDQFTYMVVDRIGNTSAGGSATGIVNIRVGDVNAAPQFIGVNGDPDQDSLTFDESKPDPRTAVFNLETWFADAESDPISYTVSSSDEMLVDADVQAGQLTLTIPAFAFGSSTLTITATDSPGNLSTTVNVPVTVTADPDPVLIVNPIPDQTINEIASQNPVHTVSLVGVFDDRDNDPLTYSITRVGSSQVINGQPQPDHPFVDRFEIEGETIRIFLVPSATGTADIEVRATDGQFPITDTFTLTVNDIPTPPIAADDAYNVALGSTLRISDPRLGLLANDSDGDGDAISVNEPGELISTNLGELMVNGDGTFTYTPLSGMSGQTDSFTYRTVDETGRVSDPATVTFNLTQSRFQNPLADLTTDVNADGFTTALDALIVINLLNRMDSGSIVTRDLGFTPPNFVDVNGDARVTAQDALLVINELNRSSRQVAEGEFGSRVEPAMTTAYASVTPNLPSRNVVATTERDQVTSDGTVGDVPVEATAAGKDDGSGNDAVLAQFVGIDSSMDDTLVDSISDAGKTPASVSDVDAALALLSDEET